MLHVAETWAMTAATLKCLPRNDHVMSRQGMKSAQTPFS